VTLICPYVRTNLLAGSRSELDIVALQQKINLAHATGRVKSGNQIMAITQEQLNKDLKFEVKQLHSVIELITKDIQDMKEALLGNEFNKEGLVFKVENNEKQIEELVKFKQKIIAWATGAGLGSGTLVNLLMDLMK
jgi:hypothetical protein